MRSLAMDSSLNLYEFYVLKYILMKYLHLNIVHEDICSRLKRV